MAMDGLGAWVQGEMRKASQAYAGNGLAKVTGGSGGFYNLELPDGRIIRHVQNVMRTQWQTDQAVTFQMVNGHYQIVAPGAAEGE